MYIVSRTVYALEVSRSFANPEVAPVAETCIGNFKRRTGCNFAALIFVETNISTTEKGKKWNMFEQQEEIRRTR
jgi:hypothetical protein